jgi:hypothetical protein
MLPFVGQLLDPRHGTRRDLGELLDLILDRLVPVRLRSLADLFDQRLVEVAGRSSKKELNHLPQTTI